MKFSKKLATSRRFEGKTSRQHPCLGYRKVTALLRSVHGETINAKRVARLRRRDGLVASRRGSKRRRIKPQERVRRSATRRDEVWSYDFIQDSLADGRTVRILSIIDEYSRECVMLRAAWSFPARRMIDRLEELLVTTGRKPAWLRSDNGPEFMPGRVQAWLKEAGVGSAYITPDSLGRMVMSKASMRASAPSSSTGSCSSV